MNIDRVELGKWLNLRSQVEIIDQISFPLTSSAEEFSTLESRLNLRLPSGYRLFCQTFGRGRFGYDWILIEAPKLDDLEMLLRSNEEIIFAYKYRFEDENKEEVVSLLDRSFVFASCNQVIFLFSQEASKDLNLAWKIHAIDDDGNLHDFGQNFFEFVRDCCLGNKVEEEFPEMLVFMISAGMTTDEVISNRFTPVS